MSAWSVGSGPVAAVEGAPDFGEFVGRVVRWIPGDIIALYGSAIVAFAAADPAINPSFLWLVIFWAATPLVVALAGLQGEGVRWVAVGLSIPAFGIWSFAVPTSGWHTFDWVASNPIQVGVGAALAGVLFGVVGSIVDAD